MLKKLSARQRLLAENTDLRARLEKAEQTLRDILSGEADGLLVPGAAGAQLFTLKDADQSYRSLIENMDEGALTITTEGLVLYSNRRFARMLGAPLEKVIGSEISNWVTPENLEMLQILLQTDAAGDHREELAFSAADGTQVPVYLSASRLSLDGMPDYFCMVATDLTKQKRNEAMLAEERLTREILEQAADAIVICDGTGRIIHASKKAQEYYSRSLHGQQFDQVFHLRRFDGTPFCSMGSIDEDLRQSAEVMLQYDDQEFNFLVSVGHLKGAQNELLGCVITMTDVTERRAQLVALQTNEKQLTEALTIAKIGYWDYETASDEFIFNDQYYLLHKITAEEAGGYRISAADFARRYVHPDDISDMIKYIQSALESRDPDFSIITEGRMLTGQGETVWVEVHLKIRKDLQDNTTHLLGVSQDITERKQAEQHIKLFRTLIDHSSEIIEVCELPTLRFLDVNKTECRMLGFSREELLTMSAFDIDSTLTTELARAYMEKTRQEGSLIFESVHRRRDGSTFPVEIQSTWVELDKPYLISSVRDITERKRAEARILYLNRVYAVLSGINTLIVHTRNLTDLFSKACRIAVEAGGFPMAVLCVVDQPTKKIVLVSSAGENTELLADIKNLFLSDEDAPKTMVARAIGEKEVVISNNLENDPQILVNIKYGKYGIRSMIVIPLIVDSEAAGALALFASEIEFFQKDEVCLLTELAGDIAFAIDHINKQARLDYLAYYDELTGLANRNLFLDRVTQYMHTAVTDRHKLAIFQLDLERFKNINDSLGRDAGNDLLKQVAEWLKLNAGDINLLARIDTDHFALVMPKVKYDGDLGRLLEKTMGEFSRHQFRLNDTVFRINAKIGAALFPDDGSEADILLRNAEAALKKAKSSGERYLFHTQKMTEFVAHKLSMENQLRQAIENEEFVLYYQPKRNLSNSKVTSAEALIRWNNPNAGLIPPGDFIPILEETGLIHEVGRWALRKAIADNLRWREAGLATVRIAVNVSALQLRNPAFIDEIKEVIAIDPHAASGLELEITESLIMDNVKRNITALQAIRNLGITIAIDDFGTGFSSLSYLAKLPVDTLKIDRSFIIDMTAGPEGLALVSTIINLAHSMNLKVVAEGVETEEQSHLLHLLKCEEMQGFLFSKPVPGDIFQEKFLAASASKNKE